MVSPVAGVLALIAPLLAIFFPGQGRSLLAATVLSLLASLFIAWQLALGHVFTLEIYTWVSTTALEINIGMVARPAAIALLVLFNCIVLLLVLCADAFRSETSPGRFSIAAGILLAVNMAALGAGEIEFLLAWALLGLSSIGFGHEHWYAGGTRWLERFGDAVLIAAMALSLLGFVHWTALLFLVAAWVRIGHLPFPLEPRRPLGRQGWMQTLMDDLAAPTVAVLLLLRYRDLYAGDVLASALCLYAGLATAFCAGLSALKVEDVRRVLSYSTAGQIALVLSALGAGAETAALFLLVLHGAAKALARSAVNSLALVAGEEWHRDRLGRLRAYVPVSSAAFALALVLLGLAPGLAGLWLWNELQTVWLQSLWFGAAFLSALQHFALLLRFFTALKVKQAQAFCALTPASRVALCALGVLALGVALAVPLSPTNWMFWLPAAAALAPALFAPLGATLLGALLAWIVFSSAGRGQGGKIATSAHSTLLAEGFYLPRFYDVAVAQPLMRVATWWRDVDTALVELGLLGGGALLVRGLGFVLLAAQNGRVRTYATVVLAGVVAVLLIMLPR